MVFLRDNQSTLELFFLRHGIAADRDDPIYKLDRLRPLTPEGHSKMLLASNGMKELELRFDAVLSSPYLRARQTAEIVAQIFKISLKKILITKKLLPPATIEDLLLEARAHFPKAKKILFVGHEPHLSEMISHLLTYACDNQPNPMPLPEIELKKGSLCHLQISTPLTHQGATLRWLMTAKQLGLLSALQKSNNDSA